MQAMQDEYVRNFMYNTQAEILQATSKLFQDFGVQIQDLIIRCFSLTGENIFW